MLDEAREEGRRQRRRSAWRGPGSCSAAASRVGPSRRCPPGSTRSPPEQRPLLCRALGEFHQERSDYAAARREFEEWARLQPDSAEPRLALLNLASVVGDGPAMEAQAEAIRKALGPDAVAGKVARAEVLLNLKPRSPDGRSGEDKARLDEVERLVGEIKARRPARPRARCSRRGSGAGRTASTTRSPPTARPSSCGAARSR